MKVIEVTDLTFGYDDKPVLQDVSFSIEEGEFVTIVGPNGGGKTTLLRLMCGLLKPWKGEIRIYGKSPKENGHLIGYVPQQNILDRSFPITVEEVVFLGRVRTFGWFTRKDYEAVEKALKEVGLWEFRDREFSSLSGGQMQRVLIARALASEAHILFLDEPISNVDAESERQLSGILAELKKNHTILVVTHDTAFVDRITDRVLCIERTVREHCVIDDGKSSEYGYPGIYLHVDHTTVIKRW